ncbi:hypothetical protein OK016_08290 [Vibrio chagasii]|nr:hypothetical protein [Vibrio chagasii]
MWFGRNLRDLGSQHEQNPLAVAGEKMLLSPISNLHAQQASADETVIYG